MKSTTALVLLLALLVGLSAAKVHFEETFGDDYTSRWVSSKWRQDDGTAGKFVHTAGKWYGDAKDDKGIQTSPDARFYAISSKFPAFSNEGKDLVLQFTVKHEQKLDCGGAYIKLLPDTLDQENFGGDSEYFIMFGPDICGASKRTHLIFNYNGKNHLVKRDIKVETDQLSHQYTLILKPDNTYAVLIDNVEVQSGSLLEDYDFLPPKQIKDPNQSKPADWVDVKTIDDPEDVKPADWDTTPATIVDPEAAKPEDWNDEDDGEWEAPTIANPEYKGAWKAKKIPNPAYKGEWEHPMIDNPEFKEDANIYAYKNIGSVGFELWQVKSGTIFDNIIVCDSAEEAKKFSEEHFEKNQAAEKKMFEDIEAKKAEEEKKKAEAEKKPEPVTDSDVEEPVVTSTTPEVKVSSNSKKAKADVHDEL
ncbi:calreticulin [Heterostelium album PN500]|uniref:Calreticulin n=1 Tax=Heterostelium pallidum (strain ATCC 26659 / Pp 5 / PN500) TaxID=670386 RepID=D3BIF1_HETP5|nr:calreticulin [Heterostelium album PN500]EFA79051.1 calreticulin [Heterostelium album PN500]|eukprot:XP_020431174.1 calreticulin [Heterostelium album PN500]